jgi:glycosyltransferase involved in cell wall biosynthesis
LKLFRLKTILKRAATVLANDPVTCEDITMLAGRDPVSFPYVVDSDFFSFVPPCQRENFLLVPGNSDRDEDLVLGLAEKGMSIIRVTVASGVRVHYANRGGRVDLRYRISFHELKALYHKARAVLLPIRSRNHAAAQTSALEAIACGAPVIITRGRTSALLDDYKSVTVCATNDVEEWMEQITHTDALARKEPGLFKQSAALIGQRHHPDRLAKELAKILSQV